jgi:hypothetical protein
MLLLLCLQCLVLHQLPLFHMPLLQRSPGQLELAGRPRRSPRSEANVLGDIKAAARTHTCMYGECESCDVRGPRPTP